MFRRLLIILALVLSLPALHAASWQSQEYGIGLVFPDGADWVPLPEGATPTVKVLAGAMNQRTNSMINVAVQTALAGKRIEDPIVQDAIKKELTGVGYRIAGYSRTGQWLQFPVNSGGSQGVVRVTAANGQIVTVTMLRGDGKNALEDPELLRASASFRITGVPNLIAGNTATSPAGLNPVPSNGAIPSPGTASPEGKAGEVSSPASVAEPVTLIAGMEPKRVAIAGGILLVLLLMVWGIVGSGKK
jgi:hypothetical protein